MTTDGRLTGPLLGTKLTQARGGGGARSNQHRKSAVTAVCQELPRGGFKHPETRAEFSPGTSSREMRCGAHSLAVLSAPNGTVHLSPERNVWEQMARRSPWSLARTAGSQLPCSLPLCSVVWAAAHLQAAALLV